MCFVSEMHKLLNTFMFRSDHKYDSGSGWPSFYKAVDGSSVEQIEDRSHGMKRVEVVCQSVSKTCFSGSLFLIAIFLY